MIRAAAVIVAVIVTIALIQPLYARPEYLARFQADPFRKTGVDGCVTCHLNPAGGGTRNDFGVAFQAAGTTITPMLRANFPDRFSFQTTKLANGMAFYFSDPESKVVVFEKEGEKQLLDLATLGAVKADNKPEVIPPAQTRMSFFVTSKSLELGGQLNGLAGADHMCQTLAESAAAGDRTWHAYLSTSFQDKPAINAGDRIGSGPWYNAKGALVARGLADLLSGNRLSGATALNEKGEAVSGLILTGSLANGTGAVGMNCDNWTSSEDAAKAMLGDPAKSWSSDHPAGGCGQKTLVSAASAVRLYCFAVK